MIPHRVPHSVRKGLDCHDALVSGLLDGLPLQPEDRVFFVDLLPNEPRGIVKYFCFFFYRFRLFRFCAQTSKHRFCEFGRAIAKRNLKGDARPIHYIGFLFGKQFKKIDKMIRDAVYQTWDASSSAPPRTRPAEEGIALEEPNLQILGWSQGRPHWPDSLNSKFAADTDEHTKLMEKKQLFDTAFPPVRATGPAPRTVGRVGGQCDYTVDDQAQPLDCAREVSLTAVPKDHFTEGRPVAGQTIFLMGCSLLSM